MAEELDADALDASLEEAVDMVDAILEGSNPAEETIKDALKEAVAMAMVDEAAITQMMAAINKEILIIGNAIIGRKPISVTKGCHLLRQELDRQDHPRRKGGGERVRRVLCLS